MKKIISILVFTCIACICFNGKAYDPYYLKDITYKKYLGILKNEASKVNDKYLVYYICEPELSAGLEKIPTLFVIVLDHNNQTMHTTAYGVVFNDKTNAPELKTCEIPMYYANFKIRRQGNSFAMLQQTQSGWDLLRFNGLGSCEYKIVKNYKEDSMSNMVPLQPYSCDNIEPLKYVFSL